MTSDQITGILRAILTALGGFILAKGWVSAETWAWLTGGILTVGGAMWSLWTNRPAGLAASVQALPGVNVQTTAAAGPAVVTAVADAKAAG
jgi:hypothetical protein